MAYDLVSKNRNYVSSMILEHRICMPFSMEEYNIGKRYSTCEASKKETGGSEGFEIVIDEPREERIPGEASGADMKCQYTHKILNLKTKLPGFIRRALPSGVLQLHEVSWNAYPYCRTVYSNPYMKDSFHIVVETRHVEGTEVADNVHNLNAEQLAKRVVQKIDIVNDECDPRDYKKEEDPTLFHSKQTGRGPLNGPNWENSQTPVMSCIKLYHIECKWIGLQRLFENMIVRVVRRILFKFHRQVFCWMDSWFGMSMEEIRAVEQKTKTELAELMQTGSVVGMSEIG